MAIVNVTPNSFSDGGDHYRVEDAVKGALQMLEQGADILDIGGEASHPKAGLVPQEEELSRVLPVIRELRKHTDTPISIDTYKPEVARQALDLGVNIINDISGFRDLKMQELAASYGCEVVCMHMQGSPKNMQNSPHYPRGVVEELCTWMDERRRVLMEAGICPTKIIFDPGIGFGKTVDDNLEILHNLPRFRSLGHSLLLGVSRKFFMRQILAKEDPREMLAASIAIGSHCILEGVDILRVHDVPEHRDAIDVLSCLGKKTGIAALT